MRKTVLEKIIDKGPKRILSLDGGGIRGALTLGYLQKIEEILREKHNKPNLLLCDYFDLIGGTSTGAIIAAGLAIGKSASEIKELYLDLGDKIFGKKYNYFKRFSHGAKYSHKPLEDELEKIFGDITLGSKDIKTGLCVIAKRADTYSIWPVHNNPNGKFFEDNSKLKLKDLLRATSAAPSYFEPKVIDISTSTKTEHAAFIDGGVSSANNPALQLFLLSQLEGYRFNWPSGGDNLLLVSLGTGTARKKKDYKEFLPKNLLKWAGEIPNLLMEDATASNQMVLQFLSNSPTAQEIDGEVEFLEKDLLTKSPVLTYQRYNEVLGVKELKDYSLSFELNEGLAQSLKEMDHPENRFKLAEIGELSAIKKIDVSHFPDAFNVNSTNENQPEKQLRKFSSLKDINLAFKEAVKKPIPIRFHQMDEPFEVETMEGSLKGKAGDYLMVGIRGELYPCDREIFEATYNEIDF